MHRTAIRTVLVVLVSLAATTLAACSSTDTADASAGAAQASAVQPAEARSLIADGARVIDVRTPAEFAAGHLAGATNIDVTAADFSQRVGELDPDGQYVLYCRTGSRAGAAADMMLDLGFTEVVNAGGFDSLAAAGLPTEG